MTETVRARWRRVRGKCGRAGGLLLAFALVGLTMACSREPSKKALHARAMSPAAESRRAEEERKMRALIARLAAVPGLEHVLTHFTDSCTRPYNGSIFENNRSPHVLRCDMQAVAYFGVQGDIADVLRRIRAADIAAWGPQDSAGRDVPHAAGTVTYALDYLRRHGRHPDGRTMPAPTLKAPGLQLDWDSPDTPLPHRVNEPTPCPTIDLGEIHQRCTTHPESPTSLTAARTRYGTILSLNLGGWGSSASEYFTVPRGK
ncbi:hypothetical protein [Streptomyces sp. WZ-12]|uniref:hypothetical protein n=1 Tax=Streptomyces sp. WZ-12 TaxID=3030210 RepID=UPI002380F899|nr:hypothetical protein [Streptomyces sp. WZ-12]